MVQRVKVQDGLVVYSAADPANEVEVDINGRLQVDTIVNVGTDPTLDGLVTTPGIGNLILSAGAGGNVVIKPTAGSIIINDIQWPDGSVPAVPGMYLGVSADNVLQFMPGGGGGSTSLTATQVAYGSSSNTVTSSSTFTYNDTTDTLSIGSAGNGIGYISADAGQSIAITSTSAVMLQVGSNDISLNSYGALNVNGNVGNAGHILTSAGPGMPATWQPASGTVSLAAAQIAFGSVANTVSSNPSFTYNETTGTLSIGSTGDPIGYISAEPGQLISVLSDTGVLLQVGTHDISLNTQGAIDINGSSGNAGYVLTSAGANSPAAWQPAPSAPVVGSTQLAFGSSSNTIVSDSTLTYNVTDKILSVGGNSPLLIDGNSATIMPSTVNGNLVLLPNGTGNVVIGNIGDSSMGSEAALSVYATTDLTLLTNGNTRLKIKQNGNWEIDSTVGTPGQVLTSTGTYGSPIWATSSANAFVVNTIADLRNASSSTQQFIYVLGYYAPADGGGGMYTCIPSDTTSVDNGGTLIVSTDNGRWKFTGFDGSISAKVFGVKADGTSDDTLPMQKAINWLSSIGGGQLLLPVGVMSITGTVGIGRSSVSLIGKGQGGLHDVPPTTGVAATIVQWNGPANGTMFDISPSTNQSLRNCDFDGIYLRGNGSQGMAAIGLNVLSCSESVHRVSGDSFSTTVVNYNCSNTVQEYSDCQHNDIWINAYQTTSSTGAMFICDGNRDSGQVHGNFSMNRVHEISGNYYNTAVIMKDCDTNTLYSTRLFRMPGSTAVGMVLGSSDSVFYTCRSNLFIQLSCGDGGLYAEGTEVNTHPSETNNILTYDLGNGSHDPVIGTDATLWWSSTMAPIGMRDQPEVTSSFVRTRQSNGRITYSGKVTLSAGASTVVTYSKQFPNSVLTAGISSTTANVGSVLPTTTDITITNNGTGSSDFYWTVEGI